MYVPLRRREKGINGHDGKNKKCNKCGTKDVINSKTQSLMKDQKESISSIEKQLQKIQHERFSTNMEIHELKKENNKLKSKSEIQMAKFINIVDKKCKQKNKKKTGKRRS